MKKVLRHFPVVGPLTDLAYYTIEGNRRDARRGIPFEERQRKQTRKLTYAGISATLALTGYLLAAKEFNTYDPFEMIKSIDKRLESPNNNDYGPGSIPMFGLEGHTLA